MKKILIGFLIGLFISFPGLAIADVVKIYYTPHHFLYQTSTYKVDTFTDGANHCYVTQPMTDSANYPSSVDVSCVKD